MQRLMLRVVMRFVPFAEVVRGLLRRQLDESSFRHIDAEEMKIFHYL